MLTKIDKTLTLPFSGPPKLPNPPEAFSPVTDQHIPHSRRKNVGERAMQCNAFFLFRPLCRTHTHTLSISLFSLWLAGWLVGRGPYGKPCHCPHSHSSLQSPTNRMTDIPDNNKLRNPPNLPYHVPSSTCKNVNAGFNSILRLATLNTRKNNSSSRRSLVELPVLFYSTLLHSTAQHSLEKTPPRPLSPSLNISQSRHLIPPPLTYPKKK